MGLQSINIYSDIKIDDLVPEGTIVDSGDYIASLDQTVILDKLKEIDANLEKLVSNINKSKIDSALELRSARDQLINQKYALEQKEIELANSKYEPPATQRKLEIDLEQAKRQLQQSIESYQLKKEKQINTIQEAIIDFNKDQNKKEQIMKVMGEFRVTAPQAGMVIYAKSWGGKKKVPGSTISPWNPRVATLPDLSNMQIKSFVNEIDISKIQVDQEVQITVDAFPDKKLKGKVVSVANIGEELNNSSAHVFEVIIKVLNQDSDLRPSMTTKNVIVTEVVDSAMYIPLECLHSNDSLIFVYTNGVKKIVETAQSNEDNIVIEKGLSPDDEIYLSIPEGAEDWEFLKD
jgi:multidrug efflux pump subunit AcrA (membrane-fusion protein)